MMYSSYCGTRARSFKEGTDMTTIAHQPGSMPIDTPERIPNPIQRPESQPAPERERPIPVKKPVKVPEPV